MKTIQISQIKEDDFSPIEIIENTILLDRKNSQTTLSNIKEVLQDIEGLREALFFKQEKLKIELRSIKDKINEEKILDLHKQVNSLKIDPLGDTKEVLQRNKEIFELKLLNKVLNYTIEIEKGNFQVLSSLLKSEDKDDWKFLCFFINHTLEIFEDENKTKLLEISKDIQDKLIKTFEESNKMNNKTMMKSTYIALNELDKNNTLLYAYIYEMPIFKEIYKMSHPSCDEIDIELYDEENNTFLNFLNELKISYQEKFVDISEIFPNYEEVYKIVNKKIFYDLVFPTLEKFLQGTSSFIFLYSIENSYKNIEQLGIFIESLSDNFDYKKVLDDLSFKYSALCIDKERNFFSEIFNKIVFGKQTSYKYILKNDVISYSKDYNFIIDTILLLIDLFNTRRFLYNDEDLEDMFVFYQEYFNKFVDLINEDMTDKISTIFQIQKIRNQIKKYFKEDFYKLEIFKNKTEEIFSSCLKIKLQECEIRIKKFISQILFYRPDSDNSVINYLKGQIFESKKIRGNLQMKFVVEIYKMTYFLIKQRIFNLKFSISQKRNLKDFIEKMCHIVFLTGNYEIISLYKYLENIVIIIITDKNNIKEVQENIKLKISKEDLKNSLKCRNDKSKEASNEI
ncbi:exocyst complex component SEC10 [Vairimorpha necatrix]|uniref:Exocyst complex component SEC10 n=1 Tax=Vairimorpha necatrix TaxID=6039 RepID=A0AAX4J8Y9_9MICR